MISVKIYKASDNSFLDSAYGDSMRDAMRLAISRGKQLRPQLQTNLYLRDCLGGLRAEIIMREGKPYAKTTS